MARLERSSEVVSPNEQSRRIAAAAAQLFAERGYDAASVREIVEAAGVAKPTLYYHFGSKEGLAKALVIEPLRRMIAIMEELLESDLDPVDRMVKMIEAHFDFCREDPHRARFFFSLAFSPMGEPSLLEALSQYGEELQKSFRRGVLQLADERIIAREAADRCETLLRGLKMVATIDQVFCKPQVPTGSVRRLVTDILTGCASPEGRKLLASRGKRPLVGAKSARLALVVSAAISPFGLAGCGPKAAPAPTAQKPAPPREIYVPVEQVRVITVERAIPAPLAELRAWETVTVGAKVTGRVAGVLRDIGDRVAPGELLVRLEADDAQLQVRQAQRKLEADMARLGLSPGEEPDDRFDFTRVPTVVEARVALERARQVLSRERSLRERKVNNLEVFQNAENDERSAEAKYETTLLSARADLANVYAAKVNLEITKQKLKDMDLRAPKPSNPPESAKGSFAYVVSKRRVAEGQMLKEGDPVFELVITDPLRVWTRVSHRNFGEVKVGQPVRFSRGSLSPGELVDGKVTRINPTIDTESRSFVVEVTVPNASGRLSPGAFVSAEIVIDTQSKVVAAPASSIVRGEAGKDKIFILDRNETAVRSVAVTPGREVKSMPGWVEIEGEVPEGAKVVTASLEDRDLLFDGQPVRIRNQAAGDDKTPAESAQADKAAARLKSTELAR